MKSEPQHLTLPRVLKAAQELGLDLNQRTFLYYVKRGLLPGGQKNPYNGADGRVAYWPANILKRLRRIFQLKQQGLKLEQIRVSLEGGGKPLPPEVAPEDWRREVAYRYLKQQMNGSQSTPPAPSEDDSLLQWERQRQILALAPLIGEEPATHWTSQFFLALHPNELQRYCTNLRAQLCQIYSPAKSWLSELSANMRHLVYQRFLEHVDEEEYIAYLRAQQSLLELALERLDGMDMGPPDSPRRHAKVALQQLQDLLACLLEVGRAKVDYKSALSGYSECWQRLQVAAEVDRQLLWLQQFLPSRQDTPS